MGLLEAAIGEREKEGVEGEARRSGAERFERGKLNVYRVYPMVN